MTSQGPTRIPLGWKQKPFSLCGKHFTKLRDLSDLSGLLDHRAMRKRQRRVKGACQGTDVGPLKAPSPFAFWLLELLGTVDRLHSPPFCRVACTMLFLLTPYTGLRDTWPCRRLLTHGLTRLLGTLRAEECPCCVNGAWAVTENEG